MNTEISTEKKRENVFEFAIFVNDTKVVNKFFSADNYSPKVRYSVDIKHLSDDIISMIQEDFKKKSATKGAPTSKKDNKYEFGLFINDYKIITRFFSVEEYNHRFRYSVDAKYLADDICYMIERDLKKKDLNALWNEYEISQRSLRITALATDNKQK